MNLIKANIFQFNDYKAAIRQLVDGGRSVNITYEKLANAMVVQKSYLSRLLKDPQMQLSTDQLFRGGEFLGLNNAEKEYMELLLEHSRSGVESRRRLLEQRIRRIQTKHAQTEQQLKLNEAPDAAAMQAFYLDPIHQLVHICVTIPRFQEDAANRIALALGFSRRKVSKSLKLLESLQLVEKKGESWTAKVQTTHLPADSPYFQAWRTQLRILSLQRQQSLEPSESYNFSVVFSATEEERRKIHFRFLELLKEMQKEVTEAKSEHCYQMNFDLLAWT